MPFFEYRQNNSGGSFDTDMGHAIYVEADTLNEANARAEFVGVYFNGCDSGQDCPCCGDRWSEPWNGSKPDVMDLNDLRKEVAENLESAAGWGLPICILFKGQSELLRVHGVAEVPLLAAPVP